MNWEHKAAYISHYLPEIQALLDRYSADGWELVSVDGRLAYFKRKAKK